jgi:pimeloyl-ACP methyl ester carboxylesterase
LSISRRFFIRSPRFYGFLRLLGLLALAGCDSHVAGYFIQAPNRDWSIRGVDAPADVLAEHHVSQQLRLNVGPPDASLLVWIINPIDTHQGTLWLGEGPNGRLAVRLIEHPQNPPTTAPSMAPTPRATIFMLNGLGDRMESVPYEFYSLLMACEGYRVVMLDLRGQGRSTGDQISYGFHESRDMVQVLDYLEQKGLISGPVGVIGVSYGGSTAICWAAIDPRVRAVVALEPFSSLREAARDAGPILLGNTRWMFSDGDLQKIAELVGKREGFDPDRESPLNAIARCKTPVLLFHGKSDDFLRPAHSIRLHDAAPDHSKLILVDDANHFTLWFKGLPMIPREIDAWFVKYLPTTPNATDPTMKRAD